jgi:hypothetical protein
VGGGLSGLVAALELALAGERVVLYEASGSLGGLARTVGSDRDFDEHSWRSYGDFYTNLQDVCARIRVAWPTKHVTLQPFPPVSARPQFGDLRMVLVLLRGMLMQNLRPLDQASWYTLAKPGVSEWGMVTLARFNKSGSAFEDIPAGTVVRLVEHLLPNRLGFRVSDTPTQEFLIDPLARALERLGVVVKLNTPVTTLAPASLDAERVISAIPPAAYARLTSSAGVYPFAMSKMRNLASEARHQEISVRLVFNRKLRYPRRITFDLHRTAWGLLVIPCDAYHDGSSWSVSVWSVTLTYMRNVDRNGRLPTECTRRQLVESVVEQVLACRSLQSFFLEAQENLAEALASLSDVRVWASWQEDAMGRLSSEEVMPANSFRESWSRPLAGSKLGPHVFLAGAHAGTGCHMWLMESAAEAGKRAAIAVLRSRGKDTSAVFLDPHDRHPLRFALLSVGTLVALVWVLMHATAAQGSAGRSL